MKHVCSTLALILLFSPVTAKAANPSKNTVFTPIYHPELTIYRISGPITIDGEIKDGEWEGAAKAGNFSEHNPGDQTKPEVDTEVFITYDDEKLYIAWICYDNPEEVRASFCERDYIFSDDYVILCLDTYGEATMGYEIAANPYGIPGDLLFSSSNGEDSSYDMVFESAGKITSFGWVVEMAIPFENLRFPDVENQVWRMDFWRNRPRESRFQYSWSAYDRDNSCWACQWGTVKGISGVKPGAGLEFLPAVVAHQSASMNENGHLDNGDIKGDLALGISYDVSSELKTEVTINPDFSQVEADAQMIDVNTTFALKYPEKRPFFQEGSDLFNTYFETVYTRSINDPVLAGKMTWRRGSNSMAFLTARDEHSALILPFEEKNEIIKNGRSYSNILRYKRDLGEQSHLGFIATDRRFDQEGSGTLFGIDGQLRFSQSNTARFQYISSYTKEINNLSLADSALNATRFNDGKYTAGLDGESFWGQGIMAELNRSTSNYEISGNYSELNPTFRADNGMECSNNYRMATINAEGLKRFEDSKILESIYTTINAARKWNFSGVRKDEWISSNLTVAFRTAQTQIHSQYMRSNELFSNIDFNNIWLAHTCFSTQPSDALKFGANINYGHRIARHDLVMGIEKSYGIWANIKPIDRFLINTEFNRIYSDNLRTGDRLFSQSLLWARFSLQISREFSARLVTQYNDSRDKWDFDPLLVYRINPFTVFYIGSTYDYLKTNYQDYGRSGWALTDRQYFMKLQYLFQT